ncbi:prevent-host-death family protein [Streptomyces sp. NPDC057539]|uniref:prevent-host-death family protein n=1 Tax=Streptomyces sp. NPDC057539 TaxID=3346159 RepID=UPI0036CBEC39
MNRPTPPPCPLVVTRRDTRPATVSPSPAPAPALATDGADLVGHLDRFVGTLDESFGNDVLGTRDLLTTEAPWSD